MGLEGLGAPDRTDQRGSSGDIEPVMLGVGEVDVTEPAPHRVTQIIEGADPDPIPRARLAALRQDRCW